MRHWERGEGVVEVVIAAAVVSIALAAVASGMVAAAHRFGPQPVDHALHSVVDRELRIAVDVLKYQGGAIAPASVATTAPLPSASPIAIHLSIATASLAGGGTSVTVSATADESGQTVSATASVPQPVPLPSAQINAPNAGPAPI